MSLAGFLSGVMDDPEGRVLLFAFFFGLVLASILTIGVKVELELVGGRDLGRWNCDRVCHRKRSPGGGGSFGAFLVCQRYDRHYRHDLARDLRLVHVIDYGTI